MFYTLYLIAAAAKLYHSELPITLPDQGQISTAEVLDGFVADKPSGLVVLIGASGSVIPPVKVWGWSTLPGNQSADINHDGFVNGSDWDDFGAAFRLGLASADFNGDGFVSGEDFDEFAKVFVEAGR